jgi:hypothetical protein
MNKDDCVFPLGEHGGWNGMTLRDWFAGQALAGMSERIKQNSSDLDVRDVVFCAYCIADAMLDEREEEE